jgi:hypothetical protein
MNLDDYLSDDYRESLSYCQECQNLVDALRDTERQCREAEDQQIRVAATYGGKDRTLVVQNDLAYEAEIRSHERQRNSALDALFSHQRLRH